MITNEEHESRIKMKQKQIIATPDGHHKRRELAELTLIQADYIKHLKVQLMKLQNEKHL